MTLASKLLIALSSLLLLGNFVAYAEDLEDTLGYLAGRYEVVGRRPDSNEAIVGTIELRPTGGRLHVIRLIDGVTTTGNGTLESTHHAASVVRVQFVQNMEQYEATYIIGTDLDNYARLTGYVYRQDGSTKRVGLEALFGDFGQLRRD